MIDRHRPRGSPFHRGGGGGGGGRGGALGDAEAEPQTAEERELAEEIERMKGGAAPTLGEGREGVRTRGVLDLMGEEEEKLLMAESEMEVNLPELLDPRQLQELLQGQDYHMMETEIEALLLKAKAEARLRSPEPEPEPSPSP